MLHAHCWGSVNYCLAWVVQLFGLRAGKGIWFKSTTTFSNLMVFWPQSSLLNLMPGQRLSAYRLCFLHKSWHEGKREGNNKHKAATVHCVPCFGDGWRDVCIYLPLNEWRNRRSTLGFVYHLIPLSASEEFFFPGFLRLCLGGLKDEKDGKKSPLVSAPQKQHPEPSCHPTWIKNPSLVAAELLTWCLTLSRGVGGGRRVRALESLA